MPLTPGQHFKNPSSPDFFKLDNPTLPGAFSLPADSSTSSKQSSTAPGVEPNPNPKLTTESPTTESQTMAEGEVGNPLHGLGKRKSRRNRKNKKSKNKKSRKSKTRKNGRKSNRRH